MLDGREREVGLYSQATDEAVMPPKAGIHCCPWFAGGRLRVVVLDSLDHLRPLREYLTVSGHATNACNGSNPTFANDRLAAV
jgi:hypothetical protein